MTHNTLGDQAYDVIVVGSGAAGTAAALAAHQAGASVLILDKCAADEAGGNSRVSGGGWAVIGDEERGATFLRAISGKFPLPDDVVEAWAREMVRNSDWMRELGADVRTCAGFHSAAEYSDHDGAETYLRMDSVGGVLGNFAFFDFLREAVAERRIPLLHSHAVVRLDRTEAGVTGVLVQTPDGERTFTSRGGVVLATGGFHANPQMVRDYLRLANPPLWGSPHSTGDGHKLAQAIGADLWHMDNMMTHLGIDMGDQRAMFLSVYAANNFIFVDNDGRRFRNEVIAARHGHVNAGHGVELHPLHPATMIFDDAMRAAGPLGAGREMLPVGWGLLMDSLAWSSDNTAEIAGGRIRRADSISELAEQCGLDPVNLENSVAAYNRACAEGEDTVFGRSPSRLAPIENGPFHALDVTPMLAWTNGGPRRDGHARVTDVWGDVIPGLYAAGEVSSTYSWGKDGGFHIGDALAFGRIAGEHAATRATQH